VPKKGLPRLYIDPEKVDPKIKPKLQKFLSLHPSKELLQELRRWGKKRAQILFDAATAPDLLVETVRAAGGVANVALDPISLPKAIKNNAEINGARQAHGLRIQRPLGSSLKFPPLKRLKHFVARMASYAIFPFQQFPPLENMRRSPITASQQNQTCRSKRASIL
jgi:hypothetical protein